MNARVRLDQPVQLLARAVVVACGDRPAETGHRSLCRDQPAGPAGVAYGGDRVPDPYRLRGDGDRPEARGVDELEHGDVVAHVVADDARSVPVRRPWDDNGDRCRTFDDVIVGQHLAGRGEHHPGAGRFTALVAELRVDHDDTGADQLRLGSRCRKCCSSADEDEPEQHEQRQPDVYVSKEGHADVVRADPGNALRFKRFTQNA